MWGLRQSTQYLPGALGLVIAHTKIRTHGERHFPVQCALDEPLERLIVKYGVTKPIGTFFSLSNAASYL